MNDPCVLGIMGRGKMAATALGPFNRPSLCVIGRLGMSHLLPYQRQCFRLDDRTQGRHDFSARRDMECGDSLEELFYCSMKFPPRQIDRKSTRLNSSH